MTGQDRIWDNLFNPFHLMRLKYKKKMLQVNLDITDLVGPGKLVRHLQNPSYTYDTYLICMGLRPRISSVICKVCRTVVHHIQVHLYIDLFSLFL